MYNSGANTLAFSTAGQQRVAIDSSGNVGIGTTAPTGLLDVTGVGDTAVRFQTSSGGLRTYFTSAANNFNEIYFGVNWKIGAWPTSDFLLSQSGNNYFVVKSATGNTGIGTTTPANKLDVFGGAIAAGSIGSGTGNAGQVRFYDLGTSGNNFVAFRAPDSIAADVVWSLPAVDGGSGNVLSTDGAGSLTWVAAGGSGDFLRNGSLSMTGQFLATVGSSLTPGISFGDDADTGMYNAGANTLAFSTAGARRMTIDSNGYVGIGTTPGTVPFRLTSSRTTSGNLVQFDGTFSPTTNNQTVFGMYNSVNVPATVTVPISQIYGSETDLQVSAIGTVSNIYGTYTDLQYLASNAGAAGNIYGSYISAVDWGFNVPVVGNFYGQYVLSRMAGSPATTHRGIYVRTENDSAESTPTVTGIESYVENESTTVTDLKGLHVEIYNNGGTVTNRYGIFVNTLSGGGVANDYSIYSKATQRSYLAGSLGIGAATLTA
ncbi:MAG: hypothetical protein AAB353_11530, partial [Candidatus Hydrogenedentota bacterium]